GVLHRPVPSDVECHGGRGGIGAGQVGGIVDGLAGGLAFDGAGADDADRGGRVREVEAADGRVEFDGAHAAQFPAAVGGSASAGAVGGGGPVEGFHLGEEGRLVGCDRGQVVGPFGLDQPAGVGGGGVGGVGRDGGPGQVEWREQRLETGGLVRPFGYRDLGEGYAAGGLERGDELVLLGSAASGAAQVLP